MLFNSTVFLYLFFPIVILLRFVLPVRFYNYILLLASLFFYAWGGLSLVNLMIGSILINYFVGLGIGAAKEKEGSNKAKYILAFGVFLNLLILSYFKYFNFFIENIQEIGLFKNFPAKEIVLPIGISFFTFQAISYIVDVYRKDAVVQKNPFHLGLYISLFPQLIAGPIVRYNSIAKSISNRKLDSLQIREGINRFIIGLAKKVIIADQLALLADITFDADPTSLTSGTAWLGIICYTLQIYFDFSGYSDMAIGIGKMLGFEFPENFNYPYISKSIKEFWRRWHISLSTWFRDYLYIPLGGNRKGSFFTYFNLLVVFLLTGLWHGASWNFIVWGLFHGFFLILERGKIGKLLSSLPNIIQIFYALFVVIIGWVLFRSPDLSYAIQYLKTMFGFSNGTGMDPLFYLNNFNGFILGLAILLSIPLLKLIALSNKYYFKEIVLLLLFVFTLSEMSNSSYSPFIYFRF